MWEISTLTRTLRAKSLLTGERAQMVLFRTGTRPFKKRVSEQGTEDRFGKKFI